MEIVEGIALSEMCDYSFGDQAGVLCRVPGGFMKPANAGNKKFARKCAKFSAAGKIMTLFIDNIRLYRRPLKADTEQDQRWVDSLTASNDLLELCGSFSDNKFIIFTSHEDTPIDEHIKIPPNVLAIHAVNALFNNEKIHPFPYGAQRKMSRKDRRLKILKKSLDEKVEPKKLLYISCAVDRNKERAALVDFGKYPWVTTRFDPGSMYFPYSKYHDYLDDLRNHKFVICPKGHGFDCHRNWETLYMRRVPVMLRHPYFEKLMKGFPVLFVSRWSDVNEELLKNSDDLYVKAQSMDLSRLDLKKVYERLSCDPSQSL